MVQGFPLSFQTRHQKIPAAKRGFFDAYAFFLLRTAIIPVFDLQVRKRDAEGRIRMDRNLLANLCYAFVSDRSAVSARQHRDAVLVCFYKQIHRIIRHHKTIAIPYLCQLLSSVFVAAANLKIPDCAASLGG